LAATTAKAFVPDTPMSSVEHAQALHRQVQYLCEQLQYLNEQHCAAATHAQYWADRCFTAETANAAEITSAAINLEPATNANEPSWEEHTRPQSAAPIAKSNSSTTYAAAVMSSDTPLSPTVKRTARTKPSGRDSHANAARASVAADPEMSLTELRHNPAAENAAAAALRTAANAAAAAAECDDPRILQAVLQAAAATANALAQTGPRDPVQAHRRGGRPPPTRRTNPRARPRRSRWPTGAPAPRATAGSRTAGQSRQHDPTTANSRPPRAGQARHQPGAPPTSSSNRAATSATLVTRNIPPLSPTVMRWNIVDRA
jgi:hypothetical protein